MYLYVFECFLSLSEINIVYFFSFSLKNGFRLEFNLIGLLAAAAGCEQFDGRRLFSEALACGRLKSNQNFPVVARHTVACRSDLLH